MTKQQAIREAYENKTLSYESTEAIWNSCYQTADTMGVDAKSFEQSDDFWDNIDEDSYFDSVCKELGL